MPQVANGLSMIGSLAEDSSKLENHSVIPRYTCAQFSQVEKLI